MGQIKQTMYKQMTDAKWWVLYTNTWNYLKKSSESFKSFIYNCVYTRGSLNTFPDFFRMGTFTDSTHMKL